MKSIRRRGEKMKISITNRLLHLAQFTLIVLKFTNILKCGWFYIMLPSVITTITGMIAMLLLGMIESIDD